MRFCNILVLSFLIVAVGGCGQKDPPTLEERLELRESPNDGDDLKQRAISYVKREFDDTKTFELQLLKSFVTHPLMGPGNYAIFEFNRSADSGNHYFVVVGTKGGTNYYPDLGLSLDELWNVHVGTDFYLRMKVKTLDNIEDADRHANDAKKIIEKTFGASPESSPSVEVCYQFQDEIHAAGKCTSGSTVYSFVVGDVSHFAIKKELAADIVWRLNMGRILSEEAMRDQEAAVK